MNEKALGKKTGVATEKRTVNARIATLFSSVRLRLTLWNVLVLGLALTFSGLLLRQLVQKSLIDGVDAELSRRVRPLRERWATPNQRDRNRGGRRPGEWRGQRPPDDPLRPRVTDLKGRNFFTGEAETVWLPDAARRCIRRGEAAYVTTLLGTPPRPVRILMTPLRDADNKVNALAQNAQPLDDAQREVDLLTRQLLTLLPISLIIAGIGAAFLSDRALRPVRAVTQAASGIGAAQDLSERLVVKGTDEFSQLAQTFNGMLERLKGAFGELERSYEQQRQFVADASHELRTPLTIIKANTSLALSDPDLDPAYAETLGEIDRAVDRTSRIVQDLFFLARSDGGQLPMDHEIIDLTDLLRQIRDDARYLGGKPEDAPRADVTLEIAANAPLFLVEGDRNHLQRLFTNLLDNALRHTPASGHITIAVASAGTKSEAVGVSIMDTGEGIPPEHLSRIYERFYRVDSARAREDGGTGLGLAICEVIVSAHKGSMSVESVVGTGTTVVVTLPQTTSLPPLNLDVEPAFAAVAR